MASEARPLPPTPVAEPSRLSQLTVRNFRNLGSLDCALPPEGMVVLGENGQGKTNLLEAIYYLVLFKSFRGARDRDLVRFGEAGFFVAGTAHDRITAGYEITGRRKKITVSGQEVIRLADAVGTIAAVVFSPADRMIVDGGPAARRRYLDVLLSLSAPAYLAALSRFRSALKQRNAALRRGRPADARAFDEPLAAAGAVVAEHRRGWAKRWGNRYAEYSEALGESGEARMSYVPHHGSEGGVAELRAALAVNLDRDCRRGMTTVGPHRDDLVLRLGDKNLRIYGSAGQQRCAAIALRLLEAETLTDERNTTPIALYDDLFAELDAQRQERLLRLIRETLPGQAILTAPRQAEIPAALLELPRWTMRGGRLGR